MKIASIILTGAKGYLIMLHGSRRLNNATLSIALYTIYFFRQKIPKSLRKLYSLDKLTSGIWDILYFLKWLLAQKWIGFINWQRR